MSALAKALSSASRFWTSLDARQRRALLVMGLFVLLLHVVGFGLLFVFAHPHAGTAGALSIGIGVTAYTLGMRHAFDADHISAIDNTTRKLISDGQRPLSTGFWFSLGHSTIVFAVAVALGAGVKALAGPVSDPSSHLHQLTGTLGMLISGSFLYLIAAINIVILIAITRVFMTMRRGPYDEHLLEQHLQQRGFMNRLLNRLTKTITKPAHMYPVGILFGLGFDTATEVALLVLATSASTTGLPWYGLLCLPTLFAAGMTLLDTIDGTLMNYAYGWAFSNPVRKIFYNLTITGLSITVALAIGTLELGGLAATHLHLTGPIWNWLKHTNINLLGLIIFATFLITWATAATIWHAGKIEQRWQARAERAGGPG